MNIILYFLIFVIALFICFIVVALLLAPLKAFEKNQPKWKDVLTFLLIFFLCPIGAYIGLAYFDIRPSPIFNNRNQQSNSDTEKMMEGANAKADKILLGFNDPDNLTISQLRILIEEVKNYTHEVTEISNIQTSKILELKNTAEIETQKAKEAQELANTVKSLTKEQLESVKFLITSDANAESQKAFLYGAIVSFPIGIISSIIASALWDRLGRKREIVKKIGKSVGDEITHMTQTR